MELEERIKQLENKVKKLELELLSKGRGVLLALDSIEQLSKSIRFLSNSQSDIEKHIEKIAEWQVNMAEFLEKMNNKVDNFTEIKWS